MSSNVAERDCEEPGRAGFIDYYAHIKKAEFARFQKEAPDQPEATPWEQKEYQNLTVDADGEVVRG